MLRRAVAVASFCLVMLSSASAAAQTNAACNIPHCEQETLPSGQQAPRVDTLFEFELLLKALPIKPKPKILEKPRLKAVPVVTKPRQPTLRQKSVTVQKSARPKSAPAALPKVKRKPTEPTPSWAGLRQVPASVLLAEDFNDIPGRYIVDIDLARLRAAGFDLLTISRADLAQLLGLGPNQIRSIQRRYMFSVTLSATPEQLILLRKSPLVREVHADTLIKAAGDRHPLSWGLDRLDSPTLPIDGRFDRDSGDYRARIYLFDSGVDRWHSEFGTRAEFGSSFLDALPRSVGKCREHGTEMASLIAGATVGSAPKAQVVDLVVLPCQRNQTGSASSLIEAAEWLLIKEADFGDGKPVIANMSLAGKWSKKINNAVEILTQNGVVVVVAAGNNAQDACRFSPASARDAITVGATGPQDETPGFSNFGQCVDIYAPGKSLTALTENSPDEYIAVNGTSGAAALVSGLLVRSLKIKGPRSADQWLANAAVPAQYWRKDGLDIRLAQVDQSWRKLCRIVSGSKTIPLRSRPGPNSPAVELLNSGSVVTVETAANNWARVSVQGGQKGWLKTSQNGEDLLKDIASDSACGAIQ